MRRPHPASIVAELVRQLPSLALFALLLAIRWGNGNWEFGITEVAFLASMGFLVAWPLINYYTTRYYLTAVGLEHQTGWLHRSRRTIAWEAVTATEVTEPLVHRLLGLKNLKLRQGGDENTSIEINGIGASALAEIQAHLAGEQQRDRGVTVVYRATWSELIIMALIRGQVVVLGSAVLLSGFELITEFGAAEQVAKVVSAIPAVSMVVVVLLVGCALGVIATVFTYYDFTVKLVDGKLISTYGLVNRKERTIDPARVRGVVLERNLIEAWLGRARLGVLTRDAEVDLATNTVLPTLPEGIVTELATTHFPEFVNAASTLPPRGGRWSGLKWLLLVLGLAAPGIFLGYWLNGWWLAGLCCIASCGLVWLLLRGLNASFEVDRPRGLVYIRRRFIGQRVVALRIRAVQILRSYGTGSRGRYLAATLSTFAGTPETYLWLGAGRQQIEAVGDTCFNGARD